MGVHKHAHHRMCQWVCVCRGEVCGCGGECIGGCVCVCVGGRCAGVG